jgi:hypothetical protein
MSMKSATRFILPITLLKFISCIEYSIEIQDIPHAQFLRSLKNKPSPVVSRFEEEN